MPYSLSVSIFDFSFTGIHMYLLPLGVTRRPQWDVRYAYSILYLKSVYLGYLIFNEDNVLFQFLVLFLKTIIDLKKSTTKKKLISVQSRESGRGALDLTQGKIVG